jgi:hypothetical protein
MNKLQITGKAFIEAKYSFLFFGQELNQPAISLCSRRVK